MSLAVSEAHIGQQGKCSRCGTVFVIEQPRAQASPYLPPAQAADAVQDLSPSADITPGVIRVGEGISGGFSVLHANLGVFVLIALCFIGISIGMSVVGQIPCLGLLVMLANTFLIQPTLTCGFYRACLKQHDGAQAEVGDLFGEFAQWVDILLLTLLSTGIFIFVCLPGLILLGIAFLPIIIASIQNQPVPSPNVPLSVAAIVVMAVCLIVLALGLMFVYPALVDRRRGCLDAIKTSWQLVSSNPIGALGAVLLAGLFSILGTLACCVGLLYAMPAIYCMFAAIYRTATPMRSWTARPFGSPPPAWPQQPLAGPTPIQPPPPPQVGNM
jgi:hypothetical protein